MKLRTMLYGLTLMLGCFVLASCINDAEEICLTDSSGKTQVVFTLMLPDNAQTRAWGDKNANYWIEGENKDNDIDLSSIKLLIFNEGKDDEENIIYTYVGTVDDLMYLTKETGTTPYEKTVYECIGTVPEGISSKLINATVKNFKFVVFANCDVTTSEIEVLDDLEEIAFEPGITTFSSDEMSKIPMWGVVSVNNLSLVGTLTLLRAMSKVTVALAPNSGEEAKMNGYGYISKVEVINYNTKGFVVPTDFSSVASTIDLSEEGCVHENTDGASATGFVINGTTETKQLTFYLLDFVNKGKADKDQAQLIVTLGKTDANGNPVREGEGESAKPVTKTFDFAPIKFYEIGDDGVPTGEPCNIVRNHYYKFNITAVFGGLYVKPEILDWTNAPVLDYTINMSTNMRLFDSWLYRYDLDNTYTDWSKNWAGSHMVVSSGRQTLSTEAEPKPGRPLHSPQIQLLTTGTGTFELFVDNTDFEIVQAVKDEDGKVTRYTSSADGILTIPAGEKVYTYFYIVPKEDSTTPSNPVAKVFLYYNDPVTGKQEVTYNYNALPGYSDDSSEIWAYFVTPDKYNDEQGYMKMYYKDAANPLVPVPTVNP